MVNIRSLSALLALASISLVAAAPAPVPSDAPVPAPEGVFDGNVTFVYLSKEDAAAAHEKAKRSPRPVPVGVDERQPATGAYWDNWDFQGEGLYIRPPIDGKSHYIGDHWNDRISSIWNYSPDKKCTYWTAYDWSGEGYCYGNGIILAGRVSYSRLYAPYNEAISCSICEWN